jgi:carbon-monoxide dehydrogenase medium subunit
VAGPGGSREIGAGAFTNGPYLTALQPGEIVTYLDLPALVAGRGSAYVKQGHPGSGYAICGVAAALTVGVDGVVGAVRIAVTGAGPHPERLEGAEEAADGKSTAEAAAAAEAAIGRSHLKGVTDLAASGAYRKHLAGVLAGRAIVHAAQRGGKS